MNSVVTGHHPEGEIFFDTGLLPAPGRLFLEEAHGRRLAETAAHFGFPGPPLSDILAEAARRAAAQPGAPWRIRAGFHAAGGGLDWELRVDRFPAEGVCPDHPWTVGWVEAAPDRDLNLWRHKSLRNRAWTDARGLARRENCDDALLADADGRALEFSRGNLFVLEGNVLITPPDEGRPLLPGLMRQTLLEWAGIRTRCEEIPWDRLVAADGVILTNALRLLVPIGRIVRNSVSHRLKVSPRLADLRRHWRHRALGPA